MPEIGILSDTHGLVRPSVYEALAGVDWIIHAGDIGKPSVLEDLKRIAPVTAVRGNGDKGAWAEILPLAEVVPVDADLLIYVLHDLHQLDLDPKAAGFSAVVFGHSHRPLIKKDRGLLYLNPGSAGPRRFSLPVTVMRLAVSGGVLTPQIVPLDNDPRE